MKSIRTYILLICLIISCTAKGGAKNIFTHYDMSNGLSQNTVLAIAQDHTGFMWFGTKNGLNRFDSHSFRTYYEGNNEHSLKSDYINALCQAPDDRLWVGTNKGLFIYNPLIDAFETLNVATKDGVQIKGNINIIVSAGNYVYLTTQGEGIFRYNVKTKELIHKPMGTYMQVTQIAVDSSNNLWIGLYGSGLYTANDDLTGLQPVRDSNGNTLFANTIVSGIVCAEQGQLFVSTETSGVNVVNINTREVTHLMPENGAKGNNTHCLIKNENELWAATEDGLYIYEIMTRNIRHYHYESTNPFSLSDDPLQSLFKDKDGGIWIGTYFGGVNYTPRKISNIERFFPRADKENSLHGRRVREMVEDENGIIWIGTEDGGLNIYNPKTGDINWISESSKFTNIHGLYADGNNIWVGTFSSGLKILDTNTHKVVKSFTADGKPGSLHDNNIFTITKTRNGTVYIGTFGGLCMYDNGSFRYIKDVPNTIIYDIIEDKHGNLWVATYGNGVYMRDAKSKKWTTFSAGQHKLVSDNVLSISETRGGDIWITTEGGGAYRYSKGKLSFLPITADSPNIIIYNIVEDKNGYLWLTTNNGLISYAPNTNEMHILKTANGLLDNNFNYKSSLCSRNGRIYAGSLSGFITFMPESMHKTNYVPTIVATELMINNSVADNYSKHSPLKRSITMTDKLVLDYSQNSITLKIAAIIFDAEQQVQLEYKLAGFDEEWQPMPSNYSIRYTNLPSGSYKLIVRVQSPKGDGSGQQYELKIKVKPPFYMSWWAWLLYLIFICTVAYFAWRYINQRSEMHRRLAMEKFEHEKEQELYQSKIRFFTHVAHEIRTPLTLIKAPLENIMKKNSNDDNTKDDLGIMDKNVNRLLDLTKQLLDFRKAERSGMSLNFERCNINNIIEGVFVRFTSLMREKDIKSDMILPTEPLFANVDKEALTKIISNLINNAVKYCEKSLSIELKTNADNFNIIMRNDGKQVPPAMRKKIFEPFTRGNDVSSNINGTGIGLSLALTLAELHGGKLQMNDDPKLNVFCLTLPIEQAESMSIEELEPAFDTPIDEDQIEKKGAPVILVVEDNIQMQQYEKKKLQQQYNVLTADNGEEAMQILAKQEVDVIVSDVMMEPMDGFKLCQTVKSDVNTSHVPFILLTALTLDSAKIKGMEAGADAYIEKPFSMDYLLSTIKNLLRIRQNVKNAYARSPFTASGTVTISKVDEEFIERLDKVIEKNLGDSDFGITEMAEQMFMSRTGLNRKIRGVFNLTPNNYIKLERLKKAALLMKTNNYKVNEVCYMVGFTSPSYFTQCFYKQFGLLPKEFINSEGDK
jgi:ligand-binding sensor domain-containing protein/signal transduction histidine kinase/DNA-binding response OmpR family regulator